MTTGPILFLPRLAEEPGFAHRQAATDYYVAHERPELERRGWRIDPYRIARANRHAYAKGIAARWDEPRDIIVLEHDVIPRSGILPELADCPEPICAVPFALHMCRHRAMQDRKSGRTIAIICVDHARPVMSYRIADPAAEGGFDFGPPGLAHADLTSLGATKLSRAARIAHGPAPRVTWSLLDDTIARRCFAAGLRVHLHWPEAMHNHPSPVEPHENVFLPNGQTAPCRHISTLPEKLQESIRADIEREKAVHTVL